MGSGRHLCSDKKKKKDVRMFVWKQISYQFRIPKEIGDDNGFHFIENEFIDFCEYWKITLSVCTPRYPQRNKKAKSTNKVIMNSLNKWLESTKGRSIE